MTAHTEQDNKYDEDIDENIEDEYKYVKQENKLLASDTRRLKQNSKEKYQVNLKIVRRDSDMDAIQKCIGQIAISFAGEKGANGNDVYRYGTGTVYKQLDKKYFVIITCAHNLCYFDDRTNSKKKAQRIFFLPNGHVQQDNRLVCVDWIYHPEYNPRIDHCVNIIHQFTNSSIRYLHIIMNSIQTIITSI
eukprot:394892_1